MVRTRDSIYLTPAASTRSFGICFAIHFMYTYLFCSKFRRVHQARAHKRLVNHKSQCFCAFAQTGSPYQVSKSWNIKNLPHAQCVRSAMHYKEIHSPVCATDWTHRILIHRRRLRRNSKPWILWAVRRVSDSCFVWLSVGIFCHKFRCSFRSCCYIFVRARATEKLSSKLIFLVWFI